MHFLPVQPISSRDDRRIVMLLGSLMFSVVGCGDAASPPQAGPTPPQTAINRVFAVDQSLSKARDAVMSSDKSPAGMATAIRQYVQAMNATDFTGVPDDVRAAYAKHLADWQAAGGLFDHYSGLSGAFRMGVDGDDYAKGRLTAALKAVEGSWNTIADKARAHGVTPPAPPG